MQKDKKKKTKKKKRQKIKRLGDVLEFPAKSGLVQRRINIVHCATALVIAQVCSVYVCVCTCTWQIDSIRSNCLRGGNVSHRVLQCGVYPSATIATTNSYM